MGTPTKPKVGEDPLLRTVAVSSRERSAEVGNIRISPIDDFRCSRQVDRRELVFAPAATHA